MLSCIFACSTEPGVFNDVIVEVEDFAEYNDGYGNVGRVVLGVENSGVVPIYSASISLRLETDRHSYYTTVRDESGIPPETKVYITVEFTYLSPGERATETGIVITDSFFY